MDAVKLINRYSTRNDRKIKAICSPLEIFNIDCFWRYIISEEGLFTYIGNAGPIAEYFFHNRLHLNHPGFRSPRNLESGLVLPNCNPMLEKSQEPVKDEFYMDQLMIIGEKTDNLYTGYCFATTKNHLNLTPVYVRHQSLFKKFIHYFLRETEPIISKLNDNQVEIASEIGEYFHNDPSFGIFREEKSEFLNRIGFSNTLSNQETRCVKLLVRGMSAKKIAEEMDLSKRTVEHYLENVKHKWCCLNKQELINRAINELFL